MFIVALVCIAIGAAASSNGEPAKQHAREMTIELGVERVRIGGIELM